MSYFMLGNGERLYYQDTEKGKHTIVMLHGWTSNHEVFDPVVSEVSKKARCITYDHRGHGNSKEANHDVVTLDTLAGDLHELIKGLKLKDITLLGWSMGAGTCLNYMNNYGCDALRQVVLCDMTPKQMNDDEWKLGLYQGKYTKENMEQDAGKDFYNLYKTFAFAAMPSLKKIPEFLLKKPLKKKLADCDEGVLRTLSRSMKVKDYRDVVGKISVPLHYFYAVPGSLFSPDLAKWYGEHVTVPYHAVAFEKSTHMLVSDQPEQFTREVLQILPD